MARPPTLMILIRINDRVRLTKLNSAATWMEALMPFDAMMVSGGVLLVFIIFAGVLAWADRQTRS